VKKLPEIYKEVININNNKNTFYSKNEIGTITNNKNIVVNNNTLSDNLKSIFLLGKNSYTKKVRVITKDISYETRLVRRNNGKILTIDNDTINESDIISLEIL